MIIKNKLLNLDWYKNSKIIAVYNNFNTEVDTKVFIEMCLREGKIVCVPIIENNYKMNFYRIESLNDTKYQNKFNINEPLKKIDNLMLKDKIDLMIVPGICFDLNKNRVGFGKGYYDRYLQNCKAHKVGVCYSEQILHNDFIQTDATDVKMNLIINDKFSI